jgi:rhodanese-related sulfurtransferase
MGNTVDARTLKAWLSDGGEIALLDVREIALLDVREYGRYGEGHLFFAVSLPYSRFELGLPALVPNPGTRLVLCDESEGVAERAASRAAAMGYGEVHVLSGGIQAWQQAGYTLYAGVNVPSKAFGELVELARHTPRITAQELEGMRRAGEDMVIVDGRTFAEFQRMNIPGGICCPNGELALRIGDIAPTPATKIVVNCAGRTRSIIGAQTLIDFGVPNPVMALENGTQGWFLAGLALENGASRRYGKPAAQHMSRLRSRARAIAEARGVGFVTADEVSRWLSDTGRTTYLLDVRTPEEFAHNGPAGFTHAPGGQLVQATDHWIGTRGARLVLVDDEEVRAPMTAQWLRQLGHEAHVLEGGLAAAAHVKALRPPASPRLPGVLPITAAGLDALLRAEKVRLIDLRPSMSYRKEHLAGAVWSIRPRAMGVADANKMVVLVADDPGIAALAAIDLGEGGIRDVRVLAGGHEAGKAAGLEVASTPGEPADAECIDFLFFTAKRHEGDKTAARQYLAWEIGLVDQLDDAERRSFRIADTP